jgi:hypothetical protein
MMILVTLLISIAIVGTAIFVAKKQESNVRPVKVRVKNIKQ